MNNIKMFFFDFGGTLDTNGIHWFSFFKKLYENNKIYVPEGELFAAYVASERILNKDVSCVSEMNYSKLLRYQIKLQFERLNIEDNSQTIQNQIFENCFSVIEDCASVSRDVLKYISTKYEIGVISNFYGNLDKVLDELGLLSFFSVVVDSAHINYRKPQTEIFNYAINKGRILAQDCIMVGDSYKNDILPAKKLGMKTIWLKNEIFLTEEGENYADHIVNNIIKIKKII